MMLKAGFTVAVVALVVMAAEFGIALLVGVLPTSSIGWMLFGLLGYFLYMLVWNTAAFSLANLVLSANANFARTTLLAFFLSLSGFLMYLIFSDAGPEKHNILIEIMAQPLPTASILFPAVTAYASIYFLAKKEQKCGGVTA